MKHIKEASRFYATLLRTTMHTADNYILNEEPLKTNDLMYLAGSLFALVQLSCVLDPNTLPRLINISDAVFYDLERQVSSEQKCSKEHGRCSTCPTYLIGTSYVKFKNGLTGTITPKRPK
ncbi:hypothetical protein HOF46_01345, partial [Candidatus Woesearchaeota archaeon]|nr:hypothetical protein [Candidatus Woesearchaeota archaeon]